jgi:uncharacterized membrane protein SirB2
MLVELYPVVKPVHVALVLASGALFVVRGAAVLAHKPWGMQRPLRVSSYAIDTGLLVAGLLLLAMLRMNPVATPWLGVKLTLLPVYIVLGSMALKRARSARDRDHERVHEQGCGEPRGARSHQPWGFLERAVG